MPTPSEQKALAFLAIVIVLAGALRIARSSSQPAATTQEQHALAEQLSAVDSSGSANPRKGRKGRKLAHKSADADSMMAQMQQSSSGYQVAPAYPPQQLYAQPPQYASARQPYVPPPAYTPPPPYPAPGEYAAQPPAPYALQPKPSRRRANRLTQLTPVIPQNGQLAPLIDLDQATAEQIDQLPRVGPAIAARIVANRDSFGAFGSLGALKRVKGMGPATLQRLAPLVTFSGRPASSASRVPYY